MSVFSRTGRHPVSQLGQVIVTEPRRLCPTHLHKLLIQPGKQGRSVIEEPIQIDFREKHCQPLEVLKPHARRACTAVQPLNVALDAQVVL